MKGVIVALIPVALSVPIAVSLPDTAAHGSAASAQECRRTLAVYPELNVGDRTPAVRTLQCAINDLGLGPVVVDGYYGPETKKALTPLVMAREGQPSHPYRLTPLFWSQLYGIQLADRTLREGDRGPAVRNLQRSLRAYGLTIVVDGEFGSQTESVVEEYQRQHDVRVTGRVDAHTLYFLHGGDYY